MAKFAIICEGVSENRCLRAIVERLRKSESYFSNIEPEIKQVHHQLTQQGAGGWTEVLKHCTTEIFKEALLTNDYLIVQIDTDRCDNVGFDVKKNGENGVPREDAEVYQDIIKRLLTNIDENLYQSNKNRIIFAICFEEIECWFLPLFYSDKRACSTTGCVTKLNQELRKKGDYNIPDTEKNNDIAKRTYQYIFNLKAFKKNIPMIASYNYGFEAMVKHLQTLPDIEEE